jgi:hypothetical protein
MAVTETLTGSGTWTVPIGITSLDDVVAIGGGGAGTDATSTTSSGAGGGGGEAVHATSYSVTPGSGLTYSCGPGGASSGADGASTTFDGLTIAATGGTGGTGGGGGGAGGSGGTGQPGGSGGGTDAGGGSPIFGGGGGGGGGGDGASGAGGAGAGGGSGGAGGTGGGASFGIDAGGAGGSSHNNANAANGTAPGGGGAGGGSDGVSALYAGGLGAAGIIYLRYTPPTPVPVHVSPTGGTTAGGTNVTITGTGFSTGCTVTFGGVAATGVTVVSETSITCTTPAHAAGLVNVVVTDLDSTSGTLTNGFAYFSTGGGTSGSRIFTGM